MGFSRVGPGGWLMLPHWKRDWDSAARNVVGMSGAPTGKTKQECRKSGLVYEEYVYFCHDSETIDQGEWSPLCQRLELS